MDLEAAMTAAQVTTSSAGAAAGEDYPRLQQEYGGQYVARRGNKVLASAERYETLSEQLKQLGRDDGELIVEYVEPPDLASAY
jgi:hypothetical protein